MNLRRHLNSFNILPCVHSKSLVDKILTEGDFIAKNIGDLSRVPEVYSVYEMAEIAVAQIQHKYGISVRDHNDKFALHKELVLFYSSSQEKQDEVLAGFPSNFKAIPLLIKKLKKVERMEIMKMNEEDKAALKNGLFLHYIISAKPLAKMIKNNLTDKEAAKLTREEMKKRTEVKKDRLMKLWMGGRKRNHKEL